MGVYKYGKDKWTSRIKVDGKFLHLGIFSDFDEAVKIRKEAEVQYNFHTNHGQIN